MICGTYDLVIVISPEWDFPNHHLYVIIPDSKIHGANMGPTWVLSAPGGSHMLAPWTLLSGMITCFPKWDSHTGKQGWGSIQFRNWNCSSIPIPIPELELELKLVELKMELELKSLELELELELKTGIYFFLQLLPQHLLVNQPFRNFSFNRGGRNLSCDWLLMRQVCLLFKFLGHCPPVVWSQKTMGMVPCSPWVDRGQRD